MSDRPKLCVSFSGGRTSAFMARWIQLSKSDTHHIRYVFANTGQEHPNTLAFVNECDSRWGLGVEWIEAEISREHGVGTRHRVVTYNTASRDGQPFEAMIAKYGIPNQAYPHCTRELKLAPIKDWQRVNGWTDCLMAVGIRADEIDRMQPDAAAKGLIYPLISWKRMTKSGVIDWWRSQPFDLDVPERLGNCVWCWKKTIRKHLTNIVENPEFYDFPRRMEDIHGLSGHITNGTPRVFFRGHTTTDMLIKMASEGNFTPFIESTQHQLDWLDEPGGCSESCEVVYE